MAVRLGHVLVDYHVTQKCHVIAQKRLVNRMPRRTVGRGLSLFAEQLSAQDWGACVPTRPRALTKVIT